MADAIDLVAVGDESELCQHLVDMIFDNSGGEATAHCGSDLLTDKLGTGEVRQSYDELAVLTAHGAVDGGADQSADIFAESLDVGAHADQEEVDAAGILHRQLDKLDLTGMGDEVAPVDMQSCHGLGTIALRQKCLAQTAPKSAQASICEDWQHHQHALLSLVGGPGGLVAEQMSLRCGASQAAKRLSGIGAGVKGGKHDIDVKTSSTECVTRRTTIGTKHGLLLGLVVG